MNFCWITFNVRNMEESLKFYQEIIGLKISERFNVGEDMEIVMLGEADGTKVELIYNRNQNVLARSEGLSIGFEVKSLDEAMELLKNKNIPIKRGPISPLPSSKFLFIDDPNGIEIQIVQHN
jgi:lactoylglutathione lyase